MRVNLIEELKESDKVKKLFLEKDEKVIKQSIQANLTKKQINNKKSWETHQNKIKEKNANVLGNIKDYNIQSKNIKILGFYQHSGVHWVKYAEDEGKFIWEYGIQQVHLTHNKEG